MKKLEITRKEIRVSRYGTGEVFFEARIYGILPGGRKEHLLSASPYSKRISISPLSSARHTAPCYVRPHDWQMVLETAPIVATSHLLCPITPAIITRAYARVTEICSCLAVTDLTHVHQSFTPEYTEIC